MRARAAGRPLSEVLNQGDMFGGETSALAKRLIVNDKGNLASREQIAFRLQKYAGEAQKNLAGPGLFGDTGSPAQVLRTSLGETRLRLLKKLRCLGRCEAGSHCKSR